MNYSPFLYLSTICGHNGKGRFKIWSFKDWGMCSDASGGYAFAETDEKSLSMSVLKRFPYIIFDVKPVLTVDQIIDSINAVAAKK